MAKPDECPGSDKPSPAGGDPDRRRVAGSPARESWPRAIFVWQQARAVGPVRRLAHKEPYIYCWVCGRPLGQGEDFGPWRVRAVRPSSLWHFEIRPVCPDHYAGETGGDSRAGLPPRQEDCAA